MWFKKNLLKFGQIWKLNRNFLKVVLENFERFYVNFNKKFERFNENLKFFTKYLNFVYSIIVNYNFPLDRLDVYILYLNLAELPKAQRGGGKCPVAPLFAAPLLRWEFKFCYYLRCILLWSAIFRDCEIH